MRTLSMAALLLSGCWESHVLPTPSDYALVEKEELEGEWTYVATDAAGVVRAGPVAIRFAFDEGHLASYDTRDDRWPDEPAPWTVFPIEGHVPTAGDGCSAWDDTCVILEEHDGPPWWERSFARVDWAITHVVPERFAFLEGAPPVELAVGERVDPMVEGERDTSGRLRAFHVPARYECGGGCELRIRHGFEAR